MWNRFKIIDLNDEHDYQRLLPGPPENGTLKAGRVYLEAGQDCHWHSTEDKEELLVFLEGSGIAMIESEDQSFEVSQGQIAFIPPDTRHNIKNTSNKLLVYIFCVSSVK